MVEMCMGCDEVEAYFELVFKGGEMIERYCPNCMANVVRETPEDVEKITPIY